MFCKGGRVFALLADVFNVAVDLLSPSLLSSPPLSLGPIDVIVSSLLTTRWNTPLSSTIANSRREFGFDTKSITVSSFREDQDEGSNVDKLMRCWIHVTQKSIEETPESVIEFVCL